MNINYSDADKIAELIDAASQIMLVGHVNPDGDAVGSLLAMGFFLEGAGKKVVRVTPNELSQNMKKVKGKTKIYDYIATGDYVRKALDESDLVICMDFNDIATRLGSFGSVLLQKECPKILIDHHLEPVLEPFSAVVSDPSSSSTCFIVYKIIMALAGESAITDKIASALYLGMMTDTGKFSYGNLTDELFMAMATLVRAGADIRGVDMAVFNSQSENRMRLVGYALNHKMVVLRNREFAYIALTQTELNRFRHKSGDTEGLVNMPMQIDGINNSALFIETDECIKISLRSRGDNAMDMNTFARTHFTGGGHYNAAGAKNFDTMEATIKKFLAALELESKKREQ